MAVTVIYGTLACLGAVFVCLVIFSAVMTSIEISGGTLSVMSGLALSAGCFAASYIVAKRRGRKGMLTGLICGGAVFLLVLLCGIIFVRSFSAGGFFAKLLMVLSCSGIGGIIGVNSRGRFR